MSPARTIVVAGAGIAGLTTTLCLAHMGYRVVLLEQATRLEETGAGLQLSPNATRVLLALGLQPQLAPHVVTPEALCVHAARSGGEIVRLPLGHTAAARYGAPYWIVHRADLQAVLAQAVAQHPEVAIMLGTRLAAYAPHPEGIAVQARRRNGVMVEHRGIALIGADGLWSGVRTRLDPAPPRFAGRVAWRASIPAGAVAAEFRAPVVHLWLGKAAHLVHYPVKSGTMINIVAIVHDHWEKPGWSEPGRRDELLARFRPRAWAAPVRALLALPAEWLKWALYDRPPLASWGDGPVTLVGDAAHPMLPFLAQGASMAIEDAAVLAIALSESPDTPATAWRRYEGLRQERTAAVQRSARNTGMIYGLGGLAAAVRNLGMRRLGGDALLARQDWIYGWRVPPDGSAAAKDR